jgi:hypothetical protein
MDAGRELARVQPGKLINHGDAMTDDLPVCSSEHGSDLLKNVVCADCLARSETEKRAPLHRFAFC